MDPQRQISTTHQSNAPSALTQVFEVLYVARRMLLLVVILNAAQTHQVVAQNSRQEIPNTQELEIPFTSPADALAGISLPEGFHATIFAHEPDVHQPIAVTTDERGRLWVAECYTYSDRAQNYDTTLKDRIVIFEDRDHDGRFDERTVFWDGGSKLTGIEVGMGGVWVTCAPNFIFIPDANKDDVPDGQPQVLLNGFEDDVIRHNIVNGLRWGPDGWLYGRHGIQATSFVGPPDATKSQRIAMNCAIWRYHPTAHRFEIVAQGGTNPWGFDYDDHGEMFMINTVIGHLFHVVPGARYRRMYGAHFNPHTYQVIEQTADHFHWDVNEEHWAVSKKEGMSDGTDAAGGGHAHTGLMVYLGNNWPAKYRNGLFTANFHGRRLNMDTVHRAGNSYVGHHGPDFMKTSDPWFRGVEMIYGPDGGVFILDWSDIGECHENDGIHRTSGRIFKVVYGRPEKPDFEDLSEWTDDELIALLEHDNDWYVRQARRLLQERSLANHDGQLGAKLLSAYHASSQKPITAQLRYLWAVYSTGNANDSWLIKQTWHANEHVRSWAIRMLADGLQPISPAASQRMIQLATQDPSGLVRLYLASSLSRLNSIDAFRMATELSKHNADAQDRVQPHLVWFGIEPFVIHHPDAALQLARNSVFPLIRENIVRRLTGQFAKRTSVSTDRHGTTAAATNKPAAAKFDLSKITAWLETETDPGVRKNILAGMAASLNGWLSAEAPDGWEKVSESLLQKADEETRTKINEINLVFGSGRTFDQLVKLAADSSADVAARRDAIEMLGPSLESRRLFDLLRSLITDKSVATQVTKSFVHCDNPAVARLILARYPHMQPSGKAAAINTLVARSEWTQSLLNAIEMGQLPREQLTASHARQIKNFENPDLTRKLNQVWGEVRESTAEKSAQMEKMKDLVYVSLSRDVDLHNGKILFEKHCVSCHILYGKGGKIGPDLTGSDRKNLSYLAENLVDPSASVAESYRSSILQLEDGRLITGIVVEENDRTVKVQTKDELVTLDRDSIEQSKKTKLSLMPDGLLDPLSNEEIVNLFRYLMTSTQTE